MRTILESSPYASNNLPQLSFYIFLFTKIIDGIINIYVDIINNRLSAKLLFLKIFK